MKVWKASLIMFWAKTESSSVGLELTVLLLICEENKCEFSGRFLTFLLFVMEINGRNGGSFDPFNSKNCGIDEVNQAWI